MKHACSLLLLLAAVALFAACGDDDGGTKGGGTNGGGTKPAPATDGDDDADHDDAGHEDEGHDDHGHEDEGHEDDGHEDHGEARPIGEQDAGPFRLKAAMYGILEGGKEAVVDVTVQNGVAAAVRAWIGGADGEALGMKAKLDGEDGDYHGHLEVPAEVTHDHMIWVEVEAEDGARHRTGFAPVFE